MPKRRRLIPSPTGYVHMILESQIKSNQLCRNCKFWCGINRPSTAIENNRQLPYTAIIVAQTLELTA